ncbi:MAG: hypothetical protein ACJA01_003393, partial [Saprospiraceae bacterium]
HKIRAAMGQRDDLYQLSGMVKLDKGDFSKGDKYQAQRKRGKGSESKQNVAVLAESTHLEDIDGKKVSRQCSYFKMKVLEDHKASLMLREEAFR